MRVFITIPWFLPAYKAGGPVQSIANMVESMNDVQFRIFCGDRDLNRELLNVETGTWIDHNENTKVWYASENNRSDTLVDLVAKVKPDILFITGIYSWHFNIVPLLFCKAPKKILSVRGMLHPGGLSQKKLKKKLFLDAFKVSGIQRNISFHASDEDEKKYIRDTFGNVLVHTAKNFPRKVKPLELLSKSPGVLSLLSIGLISPMKNHLLVLQALNQVQSQVIYHIAGPVKDMEYWQQCLEQIKTLPTNITVHYHGDFPPSKLEDFLSLGHVFILPSKSENFGHAIYEALIAGKPVITSHHTPWNGLEEKYAGINVETDVISLRNAINYFGDMGQDQYHLWVISSEKYAGKVIDREEIKREYLRMFTDS